jgi:hypothetical protein
VEGVERSLLHVPEQGRLAPRFQFLIGLRRPLPDVPLYLPLCYRCREHVDVTGCDVQPQDLERLVGEVHLVGVEELGVQEHVDEPLVGHLPTLRA